MSFPFSKSILKGAIERGLANGNLRDELRELGEIKITSQQDAKAICWGLEQLDGTDPKSLGPNAHALAALFQEVSGGEAPAFEVLQTRGIPELLRIFDLIAETSGEQEVSTLMFLLKICGLYGTLQGTLKIIEAAHQSLNPASYMWSVILHTFGAEHPEKDLLYNSLRDQLPVGFIAVGLLDAANSVLIKCDSMLHPFDTPQGKQRLREWLSSTDSEQFSYAHSATAALPFISTPERDVLLDLAMAHPDRGVRLEAAWAAVKMGRDDGLQRLAEYCRDFKTAQTAKRYLGELGREDAIPPEANTPDFVALAEFCEWCAHPNELGRAPDKLEIVDHRELSWPPERKPKPFWLIKYTVHDTTGLEDDDEECGLVGSVTFCFFTNKLAERPPEDAYAVHCYWELEQNGLIHEANVREEPADYASILNQWRGLSLQTPQMRFVAELSPELHYPQRLVGLASAQLNSQEGWVVLDGPRSQFYPQADLPAGTSGSLVLKIHIGRHLLGFSGEPNRKKYLAPQKLPKPPEQIVAAYEKLLREAQSAQSEKQKNAFRSWGRLGKHFDNYIEALLRLGRAGDVAKAIHAFAPHWNHVSGFGTLGVAAFKAKQLDLAEQFFLKYRHQCTNYERGQEMALLAELWCNAGRREAAQELLLDCLRKLLGDSKKAKGTDIQFLDNSFQRHRATFLRLFPKDGNTVLDAHVIPVSVRQPS